MIEKKRFEVKRDFVVSGDEAQAVIESARLRSQKGPALLANILADEQKGSRTVCMAAGKCALTFHVVPGTGWDETGNTLSGHTVCEYQDGCPNPDMVDKLIDSTHVRVSHVTRQHILLTETLPPRD